MSHLSASPTDDQVTPISATQLGLEMSVDPQAGRTLTSPINGVRWRVEQFGFDTVEFRFDLRSKPWSTPLYLRDWYDPFADELVRPRRRSVAEGGGWSIRLDAATRIVAADNCKTIKVVTRPITLLSGDEHDPGLLKPADIGRAVTAARQLMAQVLRLPLALIPEPKMPRVDLAVDLVACECPASTDLASSVERLLEAFAEIPIGSWQPVLEPADAPTSLYFQTGSKRQQLRIYDQGVAAADTPQERTREAGRRLRVERQLRPTSTHAYVTVTDLTTADLQSMFLGPWLPGLLKAGALVICGDQAAADRLQALVQAGYLTRGRRRKWAAVLHDLVHADLTRSERADLRSELARGTGIVLDRARRTDHDLDVASLLLTAASQWPVARDPVPPNVPDAPQALASRPARSGQDFLDLSAAPAFPVVAERYDPYKIFDTPLELPEHDTSVRPGQLAPPPDFADGVLSDSRPRGFSWVKAVLDRARVTFKPPRHLRRN